jgi:hypothetical protein
MKKGSRRGRGWILLACALACALAWVTAGCGAHAGEQAPASRLTEAQRDTAIARSQIPGARAVGRALDVAGREAAHAAQMDSMQVR